MKNLASKRFCQAVAESKSESKSGSCRKDGSYLYIHMNRIWHNAVFKVGIPHIYEIN